MLTSCKNSTNLSIMSKNQEKSFKMNVFFNYLLFFNPHLSVFPIRKASPLDVKPKIAKAGLKS
jgi:hypothetical protein